MIDAEAIRTNNDHHHHHEDCEFSSSSEDSALDALEAGQSFEDIFKDVNDGDFSATDEDDDDDDESSQANVGDSLLNEVVPFDDDDDDRSSDGGGNLLPTTDMEYLKPVKLEDVKAFSKTSYSKRSQNATHSSYLTETVSFLIEQVHKGLNAIGNRFQPAFSALHLLIILCKQVPATILLPTVKQDHTNICDKHGDKHNMSADCQRQMVSDDHPIRSLINLGYRCTSLHTDGSSSCTLDALTTDFSTFFSDEFSFGDPKVRSLFDSMANESSNKDKLEAMKMAGDKLLSVLTARAADDDPQTASLINACLAECRKTLIAKQTERRVERVLRKSRNADSAAAKRERKREKKERK